MTKKKKKKYTKFIKRIMPGLFAGVVVILIFSLFLVVNDNSLGRALFGSKNSSEEVKNDIVDFVPVSTPETIQTPIPTSTPTPIQTPAFIPVSLETVPKDDLQARKDAFNQKVKEFTEKAKAEGASNTAIANTIRFQYQLEFGTNTNAQQEYSSCLTNYNIKLSEYNACMLSGNYGCYKPVNTCIKPLSAGF